MIPASAKDILKILSQNGFDAYFAGGCVRDILLKKKPNDYDIATSATPEEVQKLFKKVIPTGIQHGTVTVVEGKSNFEVTTFRKDIKTYGRKADVSFKDVSAKEDALRRDFTINALFMDSNGKIYDFVDGKKDLKNKILRFVGDPKKRIEEDHLRILRFFRFKAQLGFKPDKASLKACLDNFHLLEKISDERIYQEFSKMVCGKYFKSDVVQFNSKTSADWRIAFGIWSVGMDLQAPRIILTRVSKLRSLLECNDSIEFCLQMYRYENQFKDSIPFVVLKDKKLAKKMDSYYSQWKKVQKKFRKYLQSAEFQNQIKNQNPEQVMINKLLSLE